MAGRRSCGCLTTMRAHSKSLRLLLAHGADPSIKSKEGMTAADYANKRGLYLAAELLDSMVTNSETPTLDDSSGPGLEQYENLASDLIDAYRTGNPQALQRLADHTGHKITWDRLRENVQLALGKAELSLPDAQLFLARVQGFESWQMLAEHISALPTGATLTTRPVTFLSVDETGAEKNAGSARDWDTVIAMMEQRLIPGLNAEGQMTDAVIERISRMNHVTSLNLNDSKQLTDAGLRYLARMPQLQHLNLDGTNITDGGLEVLRALPQLKTVGLAGTGITETGVANLANCEQLERVDLSATNTGDGAIETLAGRRRLSYFKTGSLVTDAGLARFEQFPVFKAWQGGEVSMALTSYEAGPNYLMPRGPFTDVGLAELARLEGLFALNLDASELVITAAGLAPLVNLPNLGWLAFDATDEAMSYIAAMPRLRFLGCQDTVAGDDGFVALSRSQSIEYIWGRRCYNLRARGFAALAAMPALRALSVSCKNVDDAGLSALPRFPSLRELMPMDVPDEGYRHIGLCQQLESLVLMYCRDTTDVATEHIAGLPNLKKYFASYTRITDRTMEILSKMTSLERISFYGCAGVTNAGVSALARLPQPERS